MAFVNGKGEPQMGGMLLLFLASFLTLFFELLVIRYLSAEIRVFAYLKNLPLIASFLGIGIGMIVGRPPPLLTRLFPGIAAFLFLVIAYSGTLHITHVPFPSATYFIWENALSRASTMWFFGTISCLLACVVAFFVVLGGLVAQYICTAAALQAYAVNLAGSLTGITLFSLLAWWTTPPVVWLAAGLLLALPFLFRNWPALASFTLVLLAVSFSGDKSRAPEYLRSINTFWSPYYRISLYEVKRPDGWSRPWAFWLIVNHDYHQGLLDLSPEFVSRFSNAPQIGSAFRMYELPYRLADRPREVLVVGAGGGNDVAAALRHGVAHVDAVEIDPVIVAIGRRFHPERPYDSPIVTVHVNDARAFFKQAQRKYDLIVFGFLDSHTLISSYSSLRLESYVYTLESFREARRLLKPGGSLVLTFASGLTFVGQRLFATLTKAFDAPPRTFYTGSDGGMGVAFVEGRAREEGKVIDFLEVSGHLQNADMGSLITTDSWPFLYLAERQIPTPIAAVLVFFIAAAALLVRRTVNTCLSSRREDLHFFLLGAGFMLLETKAVTELSLLFGATWTVNAVVIGAFLAMALLANALVIRRPVGRPVSYVGLLAATALSSLFPYASLNAVPWAGRMFAAGAIAGLPAFFSGLVFSRSFRDSLRPPQALGLNLLGAMVGGALENTVMIAGMPVLGVLALLLYTFSALTVANKGWQRPPF